MKNIFTLLLFFFSTVFFTNAQDVLYLSGSGVNANLTIQSGASVYSQGGVNIPASTSGIELDGDLYVGSSSGFTAQFIDAGATSSILATSTGTIHFESNLLQNITGANTNYYNVIFNNTSVNTSGIKLLSAMNIKNVVTFQDGLVYANSFALKVNTNTATAVTYLAPNTATYSGSWIAAIYGSNGSLERDITNSASTYDFPVGSTSAAQLFQVTPNTITGLTRVSCSWEVSVIGTTPLAITECGDPYTQVHSSGEWHFRPDNGGVLGSGSCAVGDISFKGWNLGTFVGIVNNQFALLWRAHGSTAVGAWEVPNAGCVSLSTIGTAGRTIAGNYAARNNLKSLYDAQSQFGMGLTLYILPIKLLSFDGWNEGPVNQLEWKTATEINSDHFDVERSLTGEVFDKIGEVPAAGFSEIENTYKLSDLKPNKGLNYYRLNLIDRNLTNEYSNVILIQLNSDGVITTQVSPNPTMDNINIQIQSTDNGEVLIELTDAIGRVLISENHQIVLGANSISLNTTELAEAMYFLNVYRADAGTAQTFKVIKTK